MKDLLQKMSGNISSICTGIENIDLTEEAKELRDGLLDTYNKIIDYHKENSHICTKCMIKCTGKRIHKYHCSVCINKNLQEELIFNIIIHLDETGLSAETSNEPTEEITSNTTGDD